MIRYVPETRSDGLHVEPHRLDGPAVIGIFGGESYQNHDRHWIFRISPSGAVWIQEYDEEYPGSWHNSKIIKVLSSNKKYTGVGLPE